MLQRVNRRHEGKEMTREIQILIKAAGGRGAVSSFCIVLARALAPMEPCHSTSYDCFAMLLFGRFIANDDDIRLTAKR